MASFLVVYTSTHGHTGKIAAHIASRLGEAGHRYVLTGWPARTDPCPHDYDAVVVGASIHRGRHQDEISDWARHHAVALNTVPSAFFSVCLAAADEDPASRAAAHEFLEDFEDRTGWLPRLRTTFAGALQYREYGVPMRIAMRALMHRGGHPSDTSRDYDLTDWDAVDAFADRCAALVATPAAT
jgi:menaquinone-dependent protoporphyrinogen oxidase